MFYFLTLFALVCSFSINANTILGEVKRPNDSVLKYYFEEPISESYPVIVNIDGSGCKSTYISHQNAIKFGHALENLAVLTVEKYDLGPSTSDCPQSFLDNNTVERRILDHLIVFEELKLKYPKWNKELILIGGSEGGTVASLLAGLTSGIKALVLPASGGGLTMQEEFHFFLKRNVDVCGMLDSNNLDGKFEEIFSNPTSTKNWCGTTNTYKYWANILPLRPIDTLININIPIYIAHGTTDENVPIESSDIIKSRFDAVKKTNLTYKRYTGLNHRWEDEAGKAHTKDVLMDMFFWLKSILTKQ